MISGRIDNPMSQLDAVIYELLSHNMLWRNPRQDVRNVGWIYSKTMIVIDLESYAAFAVLQSQAHDLWVRFT